MEVVLSAGRFGEETPGGAPFHNEEIREWSHVDRLTGMLERARVETGRWQASNEGAARSYGKVIDSRERNSADGSIVQRARRQVEIFQSQGRGRSVQVVRASRWSSSRVTESTLPTLPDLDKKEENLDSEKLLSRQVAMSERLSALLGSLAVSSTVPMRRIDSKYSSRAAIITSPKRSNSNEDLSMSLEKNRRRGLANGTVVYRTRIDDDGTGRFRENNDNENERLKIMTNEDRFEPSKSMKSAIHLLPSSKSNTTVVNLMKDSRTNDDNDKSANRSIWILPMTRMDADTDDSHPSRDENVDDTACVSTNLSGKSTKRVGFSKTEIHFAADSGKVNIVETDEKPPPTNKFRRKKRPLAGTANKILPILDSTSCTTKNLDKISPTAENDATRADFQPRCHTTTVKLGSEFTNRDERGFPDGDGGRDNCTSLHRDIPSFTENCHEVSRQGIHLRLENRIYDRLEKCSSPDVPVDSCLAKISRLADPGISDEALKSTRLVINMTKNSKIYRSIEPEIYRSIEPEISRIDDDSTRKNCEDHRSISDNRLDWPDDVIKSILPIDGSRSSEEYPVSSTSIESHENPEERKNDLSPLPIVDDEEMRKIDTSVAVDVDDLPEAPSTLTKSGDLGTEADYDIVCTDAENNRVLLKVVTTHEPTIARVENDHIRGSTKKSIDKSRKREKTLKNENLKSEHTYANVFTGSATPIYENYRIDSNSKIENSKKREIERNCDSSRTKSSSGKKSRVPGTKKSSNDVFIVKDVENSISERNKMVDSEKSPGVTEESSRVVDSSPGSKTRRIIARENNSSSVNEKSNSKNSADSRSRTISKNLDSPRTRLDEKNLISSLGKGNYVPAGKIIVSDKKSNFPAKSSTRESSSSRTRNKNDSRQKPMEVVYQTAVYNMKNEKLSKPQKTGKESRGPRYLNELICGAKTKRPGDSKNKSKTSSSLTQNPTIKKAASQTVRRWK